jgi:hypothetical protein
MSQQTNLENALRGTLTQYGAMKAEDAFNAMGNIMTDLRDGAGGLEGNAIPNVAQSLARAKALGNAADPNRTGGANRSAFNFVNGRDPRSQSVVGGEPDPATGASATPETATSAAPTPAALSKAQVQNPLGNAGFAHGASTETTAIAPQPQQVHDTAVAGTPTPTYAPGSTAKVGAVEPGTGRSTVETGKGSPTKHPVSTDNDEGTSGVGKTPTDNTPTETNISAA